MQPITFYVINIRLKCAFVNVHRKYNCKIIMYSAALRFWQGGTFQCPAVFGGAFFYVLFFQSTHPVQGA